MRRIGSLRDRLDYTCRLFDLLAEIVPPGVEGSVSTVPVSFKGFNLHRRGAARVACESVALCRAHRARQPAQRAPPASRPRTGAALHCWRQARRRCAISRNCARTGRAMCACDAFLGVNYDCCHLGVEFEDAGAALGRLREAGVKLSKIHLSNALKIRPSAETLQIARRVSRPGLFPPGRGAGDGWQPGASHGSARGARSAVRRARSAIRGMAHSLPHPAAQPANGAV